MDYWSLEKKKFFFVVDFQKENILLFSEKDLEEANLNIKFPNFELNNSEIQKDTKEFQFKMYPLSYKEYLKGFNIVKDNIQKGNSYLVNYTRKTKIETNLTLDGIFQKAKAKYKVKFHDDWVIFSPETFVEIKKDKIFTHPMKGTIDADIPNAIETLKNDIKEKAEHYTVVDLLRNDLSIVADKVQVDEFQRIDFIKTQKKNLFAMSSEISGMVKPEFRRKIGSILDRLLPAGSILGAPKKKTLEIIKEAEDYNRGFYTGVCGYFDGENLDSCVMIRFIERENNSFYYKSGGGITHLSDPLAEYEETLNKIYVPIY